MDYSALKYKDEADRALGLSGMAIAMFACDGEQFLASVNLDAPAGQGLALAPDFGFNGNTGFSAKLAWSQFLRQYELTSAMLMGNAMCRAYVGRGRRMAAEVENSLRSFIDAEGANLCQLDADETSGVYMKTYRFLDRLFTHSTVASAARSFAESLQSRRELSSAEILDLLSPLGR